MGQDVYQVHQKSHVMIVEDKDKLELLGRWDFLLLLQFNHVENVKARVKCLKIHVKNVIQVK